MSSFQESVLSKDLQNIIFDLYDKFMLLKMYIDSDDEELIKRYVSAAISHNDKLVHFPKDIDAGFDLFAPGNLNTDDLYFYGPNREGKSPVNKLDFNVICSAKMCLNSGKTYNTGYYMYPRSSLSKTQLRLANSTGIIDSGYRGHLIGMFDVVNIPNSNSNNNDNQVKNQTQNTDCDYVGKKYDRYLQICAPGLVPIFVYIAHSLEELGEETIRGSGGFGSSGR